MKDQNFTALVIAIIGIVADLIGILTFIYSANAQNNLGIKISADIVYVISHIILLYSWFIFTWFLSIRNFKVDSEKSKLQSDRPIIRNSTIATGIILTPISFGIEYVLYENGSINAILFLLLGGIIIYESLKKILVTFYPHMKKYFIKIGEYICKKSITLDGHVKITKGKKIVVTERDFNESIIYIPIVGFVMYMEALTTNKNLDDYHARTDTGNHFIIKRGELLSNFE